MPVCPFGTHRLRFDGGGRCQQCGGDLAAYAAVRDLAKRFYNAARRCWDVEDLAGAAAWLQASLLIRDDLAEAQWLLGHVHLRAGRAEPAREALARARRLGARIGAGLDERPIERASTTDGAAARDEGNSAPERRPSPVAPGEPVEG